MCRKLLLNVGMVTKSGDCIAGVKFYPLTMLHYRNINKFFLR